MSRWQQSCTLHKNSSLQIFFVSFFFFRLIFCFFNLSKGYTYDRQYDTLNQKKKCSKLLLKTLYVIIENNLDFHKKIIQKKRQKPSLLQKNESQWVIFGNYHRYSQRALKFSFIILLLTSVRSVELQSTQLSVYLNAYRGKCILFSQEC